MKKFFIYLACLFFAALTVGILGMAGISGAIPYVIIYALFFWIAQKWSDSVARRDAQEATSRPSTNRNTNMNQTVVKNRQNNANVATSIVHSSYSGPNENTNSIRGEYHDGNIMKQVGSWICINCGADNLNENNFCTQCGVRREKRNTYHDDGVKRTNATTNSQSDNSFVDHNIDTQSQHKSVVVPKSRFCRKCGFELVEGSRFCSKCGTPVLLLEDN